MSNLHSHDPASWLEEVWLALDGFRENCIPESEELYDNQWSEICTAMEWIREALGLPDEVEQEESQIEPLR